MKDFDALKELWAQPSQPLPDVGLLIKKARANRYKLMRRELLSAAMLLATAVFIIWIGFFNELHLKSKVTYWAMAMLAVVPTLQAIMNIYVYNRLKALDITETPAAHIVKWQQYHAFRKTLVRINIPIYYLLLNVAFALYFIEILGLMSTTARVIAISIYSAWMLFAYFYLGKKSVEKETKRINAIIENLREVEGQFK